MRIWNLTKTEKDKAQVTIYGPINDFSSFFSSGVSPDKVMRDLDELASAKEITLRINSGGGSAFAGMAIFELIRSHGGHVISRIDGVAASAASIIAMAGDRIIMGTGAMMMIHNPWTRVEGDAKKLRESADVLDRVSESLVNVYQARTGKTREELRAVVEKTTWLTADEAVALGFADEVDKKFTVAASIQGNQAVFNEQRFDLGIFAEAPNIPTAPIAPEIQPESSNASPQDIQEEPPAAKQNNEEDDTVKDLAELQAKHPEIYQAAIQAGSEQERIRIKAIDEISATIDAALVAKAKYEEPISAEALAFQALKTDASKGRKFDAAREAELDANNQVPAAAGGSTPSDEQKKQAEAEAIDAIAAAANKGRMEAKS